MIKKIVHITDLHIKTIQQHENYSKYFDVFIDEISEKLDEYNHSEIRIVITGDIAHHKINISNEQILLTSELLTNLSKIGKVVIIPGNHDFLENNLERIDSITPIIELMKNTNIVYHKDTGVFTDENIKWVVYSLYQHNVKPNYEKEKDFLYVGLFHGPINGFSTDIGYVFEDVFDKVNFHGCDIVLCGDIHKRATQYLNSFDTNSNRYKDISIIYQGSFIQQNFGETIKHHGYGLYDVLTNKYESFDLKNEQPYMVFKIKDLNELGTEKLLNNG
jgi:DNA repair exonuclease SbcCD nuclease subunit